MRNGLNLMDWNKGFNRLVWKISFLKACWQRSRAGFNIVIQIKFQKVRYQRREFVNVFHSQIWVGVSVRQISKCNGIIDHNSGNFDNREGVVLMFFIVKYGWVYTCVTFQDVMGQITRGWNKKFPTPSSKKIHGGVESGIYYPHPFSRTNRLKPSKWRTPYLPC